jgi:hypothetical protein
MNQIKTVVDADGRKWRIKVCLKCGMDESEACRPMPWGTPCGNEDHKWDEEE